MKKALLLVMVSVMALGLSAQQASRSQAGKNVQTVTIQTNGVCGQCEKRFNENVPYFKGVKTSTYDAKTSKLTISYDARKTNPDQLRQEVSKLGYNADNVKADQAARAKLPACCRQETKSGCGNHKSCSHQEAKGGCGNHKSCSHHK